MKLSCTLVKVNLEFSIEGVAMNRRRKAPKKKGPPMMGLFEVAGELGISIDTARRYAKSGKLAAVRIAGRWRIPRAVVVQARREGI